MKIDGWKRSCLLGWPISFRERHIFSSTFGEQYSWTLCDISFFSRMYYFSQWRGGSCRLPKLTCHLKRDHFKKEHSLATRWNLKKKSLEEEMEQTWISSFSSSILKKIWGVILICLVRKQAFADPRDFVVGESTDLWEVVFPFFFPSKSFV